VLLRRAAALYDIHGNLPALEAVLDELRYEDVERIVIGGDVFPGPLAIEAFARLQTLLYPTEFIFGNCEVALLAARDGEDPGHMPERAKESMRWCAAQITTADEKVLRAWPKSVTLKIEGLGHVLFCHGTPRDENEIFTRLTPDACCRPAFQPAAGRGGSSTVQKAAQDRRFFGIRFQSGSRACPEKILHLLP